MTTKTASVAVVGAQEDPECRGVGLAKVLGQRIVGGLEAEAEPKLAHDASTKNLIRRCDLGAARR